MAKEQVASVETQTEAEQEEILKQLEQQHKNYLSPRDYVAYILSGAGDKNWETFNGAQSDFFYRTFFRFNMAIFRFNMVKKTEHGYAKVIQSNFVARQQAPEIFDMNASMYAYKPDFLRAGKGIFDGYCEAIQMYDTGILDLDRGDDFVLMEVVAGYLFKANNGLGEIFDNITITKC